MGVVLRKALSFVGIAAIAAATVGTGLAPASAVSGPSDSGLHPIHDHGHGHEVDYVIAPIDTQPVAAAVNILNTDSTDPLKAPKPQGDVKVTFFNLLDPRQAQGSGLSTTLVNNLVNNTNTWLRGQGISEEFLNLNNSGITTIQLPTTLADCTPGSALKVIPQAEITSAMRTDSQYDTALIVAVADPTFANCQSAGMAYVGRPMMILTASGSSANREHVFQHELGHSLGLLHAAELLADKQADVRKIITFPLPPNMAAGYDQYGDQISIMGGGRNLTNTEKAIIGYGAAQQHIRTATPGRQSYTLESAANRNSTTATQTLIVEDAGRPMYSVEYWAGAQNRGGLSVTPGIQIKTLGRSPLYGEQLPGKPHSMTHLAGIGSLTWTASAGTSSCVWTRNTTATCNNPMFTPGQEIRFPNGVKMTVNNADGFEVNVSFDWSALPDGPVASGDSKAPKMVNESQFRRALATAVKTHRGTVANSKKHRRVNSGATVRIRISSPRFADNEAMKSAQIRVNGSVPANTTWQPTAGNPNTINPINERAQIALRKGKLNYVSVIAVDEAGNRFVKHWTVRIPR